MKALTQIIREIAPVSDAAIAEISAHICEISLKKKETLVKEGSCCPYVFFLRSGILRCFHDSEDGKEDIIWFATEGDAVASMHSVFKKLPAIGNIEAITPAQLYKISYADLESLFLKHHELANWGRLLAEEELYCLERRYSYTGYGDAYNRFRAFMRMRPIEMVREIPLKYIAAYLDIAPQTLSKLRRRYAKDNN